MDYTQILSTDYNGLEHVSIGQTRGGNDEWITPVTLWELDTSTGLYMPPGTSTNPKAPRVAINGRKAEVSASDYGQTLNVAPSGAANILVTPSAGQLWRIKSIYLYLAAPSGATSGTHSFLVGYALAGSGYDLLLLSTAYNKTLMIRRNIILTVDSVDPFDAVSQIKAITSLVVTNACPLSLYYTNQTNAAQTGNLTLRIVREVEYIEP